MPRKEACESFYVCRDANCIFLFAAARDLVKREKGDQKNVFRKKRKHILLNNTFSIKFFMEKLAQNIR